jgi:RNA binding activity-knot of a chromodomain
MDFRRHLWLTVTFLLTASLALSTPIANAALCRVGDTAQVLDDEDGRWYPADVLNVNGTGDQCFIHYFGYSHDDDEWVGRDRIKIVTPYSGPPISPDSLQSVYNPGDRVSVLWQGKYYLATIRKVSNDDLFLIHYDGYDSSWDEWVEPNRIRPFKGQASIAPDGTGKVYTPVQTPTLAQRLRVGGDVEVLWQGTWYPATIMKVGARNLQYYIHYKGYGNNWDEWVGTTRIR